MSTLVSISSGKIIVYMGKRGSGVGGGIMRADPINLKTKTPYQLTVRGDDLFFGTIARSLFCMHIF